MFKMASVELTKIVEVVCESPSHVTCNVYTVTLTLVVLSAVAVADEYHPVSPLLRSSSVPHPRETSAQYWTQQAEENMKTGERTPSPNTRANNIVMFLGDGMSIATITAARILLGQRSGDTGEESQLYFETFPTTGLLKTYCTDSQVPDSACTATAYLCGVKTNAGCIGVSAAVARGDCAAARRTANQLQSLADWALADGRDVGMVSTARVTHASPAAMFAHVPERTWEHDATVKAAGHNPRTCPDIAYQLVHMHPGNLFKVILGGGRSNFLPQGVIDEEGAEGKRLDGRNLISEWAQDKAARQETHKYIWNRDQLMSLEEDMPEYLLGLFESSHLQYNLEANKSTEPTLAELTETAIKMLRRNKRGYFLFVEGGRIDHAHHYNRVGVALDETIELSKSVARAAALLPPDEALLLVTSDHGHALAFTGAARRGQDILGPAAGTDARGVPYMTLAYTGGPGARPQRDGIRHDVTKDADYRRSMWQSHAEFPLVSAPHGGEDVVVFAMGAQHHTFSGVYEQSELPHRVARAACIGPARATCRHLHTPLRVQLATAPPRLRDCNTYTCRAARLALLLAALWAPPTRL